MVRRQVSRVRERLKDELLKTFVEKYTEREVAFSFSLGVFITALPSLGVGILVFFALAFLFDRVSKVALFASMVVLNPVVKWGVYGASYSIGSHLLGPTETVSFDSASLSLGEDVLARLWLGNLILATLFGLVAYAVGLRIVRGFRRRAREGDLPVVDISADGASDE